MKLLAHTDPSQVRGLFWRHSPAFIKQLAQALQNKRVVEIFAGNGYLASLLSREGIHVTATSVLSGMDAHQDGLYHPVEELNAVHAVLKYRDDHDVLLMAWPTTTDQAFVAATYWGKPIVFIGEVTDYAKGQLGGCATDEFFEHFEVTHTFDTYQGRMYETACIGKMGPANPKFARDVKAWENGR